MLLHKPTPPSPQANQIMNPHPADTAVTAETPVSPTRRDPISESPDNNNPNPVGWHAATTSTHYNPCHPYGVHSVETLNSPADTLPYGSTTRKRLLGARKHFPCTKNLFTCARKCLPCAKKRFTCTKKRFACASKRLPCTRKCFTCAGERLTAYRFRLSPEHKQCKPKP